MVTHDRIQPTRLLWPYGAVLRIAETHVHVAQGVARMQSMRESSARTTRPMTSTDAMPAEEVNAVARSSELKEDLDVD